MNPANHWSLGMPLPFQQGIRCGEMIFVAGPVDLDGERRVRRPGDLSAQARGAMEYLARVLAGCDAELSDLVRLDVFYASDGRVDEQALLTVLAECLGPMTGPGPVVMAVPLPTLACDGKDVEIAGIAMRGADGTPMPRRAAGDCAAHALPAPFSAALRCGGLVFSSGIDAQDADGNVMSTGDLVAQSALVPQRIGALLAALGASFADVVNTEVFRADGGTHDHGSIAAGGQTRASFYTRPGPACTGIPVPRLWPDGSMLRNAVVAAPGAATRTTIWPKGHWNWTVAMPYSHGLRCGDLVWIGGQAALDGDGRVLTPGDMQIQTRTAMDCLAAVLRDTGLGLEHVVRANTYYTSGAGHDELRRNADVRVAAFRTPGPTSTAVPVPWLAYRDMCIEINAWAMA